MSVRVTVNGVTVECELSEVAAVKAALGGSRVLDDDEVEDDGYQDDEEYTRPSSTPLTAAERRLAEEYRQIRSGLTSDSVDDMVRKAAGTDPRRRNPMAGTSDQS